MPTGPTLHLRLSDLMQIEREGAPPLPLVARDAALLAWLAIEGPTTRQRLGMLLWPDSSDIQARSTLRQRLFKLKKLLGADVATGSPLLALADGVEHDLLDAVELLADAALPDAPELEQWLSRQREQRQQREVDALAAQAQALEDAGEALAALPVARSLLRLQPHSEAAHRRVIRLLYLTGDRAAALAAFDACEDLLKHELGTRPAPETLALLDTIEQSSRGAPGSAVRVLPAAVQRPPHMVGRDHELRSLQLAWHEHQVAIVVGEAGMGKSRLLAEFVQARAGVARAAGRPGDVGVPYATLARMLRAVVAQHQASKSSASLASIAPVLPGFGDGTRAFAASQSLALQQSLVTFLRSASALEGIVLDDLHFADQATLELLQSLLSDDDLPALQWALAFRPAEAGSPLQGLQSVLAGMARLRPVPLAPLGIEALVELVDQLGLGLNSRALAPLLLQRTGGNPLFVLETLKAAWFESGAALAEGGTGLPRPMSVERLIDQRIGQLSPPALALARVAAVAGEDFDIELAVAVLAVPAMQLASPLAELEAAQVMRGLQFAHDLVFDAVLRSVPQAIAEHTHAQVARWMEQHAGEPARVARHWIAAAQPDRAVPWLGVAASAAQKLLRAQERLEFLQLKADIESLSGDSTAAFEALLDAAMAHLDVDTEATVHYERCDRLDALAATPVQAVRAAIVRVKLATRRHDHALAEQTACAALEVAIGQEDPQWAVECHRALMDTLVLQDRAAEALVHAEACLSWVDAHAPLAIQSDFHATLGVLYDNTGQLVKAMPHHERALSVARESANPFNCASIPNNLACNRFNAGELQAAVHLLTDSLRAYAEIEGTVGERIAPLLNLTECLGQLGRYQDAARSAQEVEDIVIQSAPVLLPVVWVHRAACMRQLGQWSRLKQWLDQIGAAADAPLSARVRQHRLAFAYARQLGQADATRLDEALALLGDNARPDLREMLLIERSLTLDPEAALHELDAARGRAHERAFAGHVLETHVRSAQLALSFDASLARRHASAAVALSATVDLPFSYRGELWLHCAQAFLLAGDEASAHHQLRLGREWVLATAQDQVSDEFRESFLQRNPSNRALLLLAAQHLPASSVAPITRL